MSELAHGRSISTTSMNIRDHYRDGLRRYYNTHNVDCLNHIYQLVQMMLNIESINNLEQRYGKEKYNRYRKILSDFPRIYAEQEMIAHTINHIRDDSDLRSGAIIEKLKPLFKRIHIVSASIPAVNFVLWKMYYDLISNSELKNIPVPREAKYQVRPSEGFKTT